MHVAFANATALCNAPKRDGARACEWEGAI